MPRTKIMSPQQAKWRVRYALKKGLEPAMEDLLILAQEGITLESLKTPAVTQQVFPTQKTFTSTEQQESPSPDTMAVHAIRLGEERTEQDSRPSSERGKATSQLPKDKSGKDWYDFVEKRLGPLVVVLIFIFTGDEEKAGFYAPNPEECKKLAPHIARLAPRAERLVQIPPWVHEALVTSDDQVALLMLVVSYLSRIGVMDKLIPAVARKISGNRDAKAGPDLSKVQQTYTGNGATSSRELGNFVPLENIDIGNIGGQYS